MKKPIFKEIDFVSYFIWACVTAMLAVIFIAVVALAFNAYRLITCQHSTDTDKVVTITGFQEPMMLGYSFLDTADKQRLSSLGPDRVDIKQDLGVKATITTYVDGKTHRIETADVWMWRLVE